ncbi:arylsulfatase [Fulvivirga sp. M361]|nr:arylsulfatase [Fulvivirga sp. M361]
MLLPCYQWLPCILFLFIGCSCSHIKEENRRYPNIILLYTDDLGYGDVGAYGAIRVKTPNIDFMAENGIKFTDAHCSAATCTPSRYSLLTGNYAFRRQAKVLPGDAPLLIEPGTPTLPAMLREAGYKTGVVGKWHLGLGDGNVDWNQEVRPGPLEIGFDYSFLLPSTGDRVPAVYLENYKVLHLDPKDPLKIKFTDDPSKTNPFTRPTGITHPDLLKQQADPQHSGSIINGISRIGFMGGGVTAEWVDEDMSDVLLEKAVSFISDAKEQPFFLYFSFHDIHVPRAPHARFEGASEMGPRGDAIAQMDWVSGQILQALKNLKIENETLVLFTSDNGPVLNDGYEDGALEAKGDHQPAGPFRGGKYSAYEAGTRVPTIAYWHEQIKPQVSNALWSQTDLFASFAALVGKGSLHGLTDSKNMLDVLLGKSEKGRDELLEESYTFSLRKGNWKYIMPSDKDYGWVEDTKGIASGILLYPQLYDLTTDIEEKTNLATTHPEKLKEMQQTLDRILNE